MKTILVCTDFSLTGNNAVKFAIDYASSSKYSLVVFHVVRMPKFSPTISEAAFLELEKKEESTQRQKLESLVDKTYHSLSLKKNSRRVKIVAKNGIFVTETLVAAAKNHKADLIIVGTHGATGLKLFGSITSELIFKAGAPVLAIPPRYRFKKINTMVYATDFRNTVSELLCIVPLAMALNATVEVLHLDFGMSSTTPILETKDLVKQVKYKKIKVIVQKDKQGHTVSEQIVQHLKKNKSEVLVMFPEERSLLDKLFVRSRTEELVYDTKIPLLTIQKSSVKP